MRGYIPQAEKSYWETGTKFAGENWGKILGGGIAAKYLHGKLATPETAEFFKKYLKDPKVAKQLDELLKV